jgi:fructose-1,6-bisphosphatase/inositol monophosphatase family enzyme
MPSSDVQALAKAVLRVRTAATCGLELCYVADGRLDGLIKLNQAFYDYIGGSLILKESAGEKALLSLQGKPSVLPLQEINSRCSFIANNAILGSSITNYTQTWGIS